jgi:hypothetical protein
VSAVLKFVVLVAPRYRLYAFYAPLIASVNLLHNLAASFLSSLSCGGMTYWLFFTTLDLLSYVLPHILPELLSTPNTSGRSTPLHWAAMNSHLQIAKALIEHPGGPGPTLVDAHNSVGRSPLGEAEMAGWEEGAKYFVEVMGIQEGQTEAGEATDTVEMESETKGAAKKVESFHRAAQGLSFESETARGPLTPSE